MDDLYTIVRKVKFERVILYGGIVLAAAGLWATVYGSYNLAKTNREQNPVIARVELTNYKIQGVSNEITDLLKSPEEREKLLGNYNILVKEYSQLTSNPEVKAAIKQKEYRKNHYGQISQGGVIALLIGLIAAVVASSAIMTQKKEVSTT